MVRLAQPLPEPGLFFYRTATNLLYVVCLCNVRTRVKNNGRIEMHGDHNGGWCVYSGAPIDDLPQKNSPH